MKVTTKLHRISVVEEDEPAKKKSNFEERVVFIKLRLFIRATEISKLQNNIFT
jgi:hypothetical protein